MAKQKKVQHRRAPRAADPRMYGDGKPSATADKTQTAAQATTSAARTEGTGGAPVPQGGRNAATAPRTSTGAGGSYARGGSGMTSDYTYVKNDLRRLGIMAAAIIGGLVVLGIILP